MAAEVSENIPKWLTRAELVVAEASSLETLKARLDRALNNLLELQMSLLTAGGLD